VVADSDARYLRADRFHHAGAFVPEHARAGVLGGPVDGVPVRVADAAGVQPDEHLLRPGRREVELGHDERAARLLEYDAPNPHAGQSLGCSPPEGPRSELAAWS